MDDDEEEEEEDDEIGGIDEDECGVVVSITSPEEEEDPEGKRNSMSPCLQTQRRQNEASETFKLSHTHRQLTEQHTENQEMTGYYMFATVSFFCIL